jgi:hypothetical protein
MKPIRQGELRNWLDGDMKSAPPAPPSLARSRTPAWRLHERIVQKLTADVPSRDLHAH